MHGLRSLRLAYSFPFLSNIIPVLFVFHLQNAFLPAFPSFIAISLFSLTATIFHFPTRLVSLYLLLSMSPCSSVSGWKAPVLVIHSHNTSVSGFGKALKQAGGLSSEPRTKKGCAHTDSPTHPSENTALSHTQLSIATEQTYRLQIGLFISYCFSQNHKEID